MNVSDKKVTSRYNRATTMSPTMENSAQRDFVNGGSAVNGNSSSHSIASNISNGGGTLERKKKELSSILRNKSVERSIDTVDASNANTNQVNGEAAPKLLSKENLSKHVRIFAVDNSDSELLPTDSEGGYISDHRPSFGSLRGFNYLHSRRMSIDSLDTRRGDSRRGSIASVPGEEVLIYHEPHSIWGKRLNIDRTYKIETLTCGIVELL